MRVVILGGSAQSTPTLFAFLAASPELPDLDIVLVGRSNTRLAAINRAGNILLRHAPVVVSYKSTEPYELEAALDGAEVVVLQVRIGGYAGRDFDESFPLKYGVCGDEGLGPGGLSAAWRSWPQIQDLLQRINLSAPDALIILLTSPIGILTRASLEICGNDRVLGICELPWTTLLAICNSVGVPFDDVAPAYFGVNHIGWFYQVLSGKQDLVREYANMRQGEVDFPTAELIQRCSGIPGKYLRLHYYHDEVLEEQKRRTKRRGQALDEISRVGFSVFSHGDRPKIMAVLQQRPAPWYTYAVGPLLLGLAGSNTPIHFYLSVRNMGEFPDLQPDDILELAHEVSNRKLVRQAVQQPIPSHIAEVVERFLKYERTASSAVLNRDALSLQEALALHPWVRDKRRIQEMAQEIVVSNRTLESRRGV